MTGLIGISEAFGHQADLFTEIKEVGYSETPFYSLIGSAAPTSRANSWDGHTWKYIDLPDGDDNAHVEGSEPAPAESFQMAPAKNYYQIFKNTFGVTGSEDAAMGIDDKKELARQMALAQIKHRKSIELALLSATSPVQGNKNTSTAGLLGGVKHFLTADTDFGQAGTTLSWSIFREGLKVGFLNGIPMRCAMMNDVQKDALDDILFAKSQNTNMSATKIDNNVTTIGQTAYGNNIQVILNPNMADDEIVFFNPEYIKAVVYRPTKILDIARTKDAIEKELITELTLRIDHKYALCRLKGLKV